MGRPTEPKPVKFFAGLLSADVNLLVTVESDLIPFLGAIDDRSDITPWTVSKYYEKEMGPGLLRRFVSFAPLLSPGRLSEIKLMTQQVEDNYRRPDCALPGRKINIDPGYVEAGKVVLGSTKYAGHRLYLQAGIYGETTLLYYDGALRSCPYTYTDYLWPETLRFLNSVRSAYLNQLKEFIGVSPH